MPTSTPPAARREPVSGIAARPEPHDLNGRRTWLWRYTPADEVRGRVLLVHGFRGDHHGLEGIARCLAAAGVEALVPDLPGFGRSRPFAHRHDVRGYATWLRALCDGLGAGGEPVAVLGHSFGSIVAAHAVAAGLATDRLVLLNPIALAPCAPRDLAGRTRRIDAGTRLSLGYYRLAATLPEAAGLALLRSRPVVRLMSEVMATTHDRQLRRFIHAQHRDHFSDFASRRVVLESFDAASRHDVAEVAASIATPTLLVAGSRDLIARPRDERSLVGRFPAARLEFLDGVGHLVHYEAAGPAAGLVADFVAPRP